MSKSKHSPEWILGRIQEYLSGQGSYKSIAEANGIGHTTLSAWVQRYREQGAEIFTTHTGNAHYSKEFKETCVEAVLQGKGSVDEIVAKYNISSRYTLRSWIKKYNANMELKDYDPKREVYMAEARRKTTQEERIEITEYCLSHNMDYKGTAEKYDVSYSQVYSWVKKYTEKGESGLTDLRGHHKTDGEVDKLERLRRENLRLKRQLEEKDMLVELLKKVRELERR